MSRISVIVPVYNKGNKLEKCIISILSQNFISKVYLNAIEHFKIEYLFQLRKKCYRVKKRLLTTIPLGNMMII
jgi:cellulose synthase/poly-beta-1,6-N-acetylglucosamine synthase-like glycosyltransferase